jgi:hypothetical protein
VTCEDVVIAAHKFLGRLRRHVAGATLFQTKLAVTGGRRTSRPGVVPDALWWNTADPYQFLRIEPHRDHEVVIIGGNRRMQRPATDASKGSSEPWFRTST